MCKIYLTYSPFVQESYMKSLYFYQSKKLIHVKLKVILIVLSFLMLCGGLSAQPPKKKTVAKKSHSAFYKTPQLDKAQVKQYMDSIGIKNSDIVLRQALYETGYFKHKAGMQKNNLFGFRHSKTYMRFSSWRACVDYYKKWQDKNYQDATEDYYKFLERIKYARSPVYIAHLKNVKV